MLGSWRHMAPAAFVFGSSEYKTSSIIINGTRYASPSDNDVHRMMNTGRTYNNNNLVDHDGDSCNTMNHGGVPKDNTSPRYRRRQQQKSRHRHYDRNRSLSKSQHTSTDSDCSVEFLGYSMCVDTSPTRCSYDDEEHVSVSNFKDKTFCYDESTRSNEGPSVFLFGDHMTDAAAAATACGIGTTFTAATATSSNDNNSHVPPPSMFSFGNNASSSNQVSSSSSSNNVKVFSFGDSSNVDANSSAFSFGNTQKPSSSTNTHVSSSLFSFGDTDAPSSNAFSVTANHMNNTASTVFSFGNTGVPSSTASSSTANHINNATSTVFSFNKTDIPTSTTSSSKANHVNITASTVFSFGNTDVPSSTASSSTANHINDTASTVFSFGNTNVPSSTASSSTANHINNTASTVFSFGNTDVPSSAASSSTANHINNTASTVFSFGNTDVPSSTASSSTVNHINNATTTVFSFNKTDIPTSPTFSSNANHVNNTTSTVFSVGKTDVPTATYVDNNGVSAMFSFGNVNVQSSTSASEPLFSFDKGPQGASPFATFNETPLFKVGSSGGLSRSPKVDGSRKPFKVNTSSSCNFSTYVNSQDVISESKTSDSECIFIKTVNLSESTATFPPEASTSQQSSKSSKDSDEVIEVEDFASESSIKDNTDSFSFSGIPVVDNANTFESQKKYTTSERVSVRNDRTSEEETKRSSKAEELKCRGWPHDVFDHAEELKEFGNGYYLTGRYHLAIQIYSRAINYCLDREANPDPVYYLNRSASYVMLRRFRLAWQDAAAAILLDEKSVKAHARCAKCLLYLGDLAEARKVLNVAANINSTSPYVMETNETLTFLELVVGNTKKALAEGKYTSAKTQMETALKHAEDAPFFLLLFTECVLREHGTSIAPYKKSLLNYPSDFDAHLDTKAHAIMLRGLYSYYGGVWRGSGDYYGIEDFQLALETAVSPDLRNIVNLQLITAQRLKSSKDSANAMYAAGDYDGAFLAYAEALKIDVSNHYVNARLHFNRSLAASKLGMYTVCVECCDSSAVADAKFLIAHPDQPKYLKPIVHRLRCFVQIGDTEVAAKLLEELRDQNRRHHMAKEINDLLKDAVNATRVRADRTHYDILGVVKTASTYDIKKAYHKKALELHPDKCQNSTEMEQLITERLFKEVGQSYAVLSDETERRNYNSTLNRRSNGNYYDCNISDLYESYDRSYNYDQRHGKAYDSSNYFYKGKSKEGKRKGKKSNGGEQRQQHNNPQNDEKYRRSKGRQYYY